MSTNQNSEGGHVRSDAPESWHRRMLEHRSAVFAILTTVAISIGGIVEIVPMMTIDQGDSEMVSQLEPYTPLELAGRDIYVREGCYNCHSQMVRPFRAETMRYGEWSRSWEVAYDRPFQLGSRRIGPDLAREGSKYPDAWHWEHMADPRATSPGSIMPPYPWLYTSRYEVDDITASVTAMKTLGVPYSDEEVANVSTALSTQSAEIVARLKDMNIQAEPDLEIIALISYLQRLGTDGKAAITNHVEADVELEGGA